MSETATKIAALRQTIEENTRIQAGGAQSIEYVDVLNALPSMRSRQNHVVFGRRGCGKTLLLRGAFGDIKGQRALYINCENYKQHSFPNVLIEILDAVFEEMAANNTGWFGRKRRIGKLIEEIVNELRNLRERPDESREAVVETRGSSAGSSAAAGAGVQGIALGVGAVSSRQVAVERRYEVHEEKIKRLDLLLPRLKQRLREIFKLSSNVHCVFVQLDDFYHLPRDMHPFIADYVHRLCKDLPLFFKIATIRHATVLYVDRGGRFTGAQEHHDYLPVDVDFMLSDFGRTSRQIREILCRFGEKAGMKRPEVESLFTEGGFERLVLASGGVPRDFLSLFLEALGQKDTTSSGQKVGRDDVRLLARKTFIQRIEELKGDSEPKEHDSLLRAAHAVKDFCVEKKRCNVFLVSERELSAPNGMRDTLNRLVDYRICHSIATALTHRAQEGTFAAYMVDIGAYANMRTLQGRFREIDITERDAREQCRTAPILDEATLESLCRSAPANPEVALRDSSGAELAQ